MKSIRNVLSMAGVLALTLTAAAPPGAAGPNEPAHSGKGHDGMSGMMGMMGQMSGMMKSCPMMQQSKNRNDDSERPNGQWREKPSSSHKKDG